MTGANSNGGLSTGAYIFAAILFAVLALVAANDTAFGLFPNMVQLVLGLGFIGTTILLTVVTAGDRVRLSLQVTAIYFSIYLLLPGFNHSAINRFPFYTFSYPSEIRLSAATMIVVFLICMVASYYIATRASPRIKPKPAVAIRSNVELGIGLTAVAIACAALFLNNVGLSFALAPRASVSALALEEASAGLIVQLPRTFIAFPVIYAILLIAHCREKSLGWVLLAINLPLFLILNFPPALPRFQSFGWALLFTMLVIDFRRVSRRAFVSVGFIFGALILLPLADHFTRQGRTLAELDLRAIMSSYFSRGDFDGFQSVNNAVVYVEMFGLEYGRQLLSVLFFFVPRSIWGGKAEATGSITAEAAGYRFTNISQPLPSEFFVDFGWAGVVIGASVLGWAFFHLDRWFDRCWMSDIRTRLVAGLLLGYGVILFRGSLLGVVPPIALLLPGLVAIAVFGTTRIDPQPAKPQ